jgi:hypothetical protein
VNLMTQKQWNGVLLAGGLLIVLLFYSALGLMFIMGWSWEEVARAAPSPDLPPIPPFVWDAFLVVISAMVLLGSVAIVAQYAERRRRAIVPVMPDEVQLQREREHAQEVEQENTHLRARLENAWGVAEARGEIVEPLRNELLKSTRKLAAAEQTIAILKPLAANAPQRAEPALPALTPEERATFWASINYGAEVLNERWARRIEQRLKAAGVELVRTGGGELASLPANLPVKQEKKEREVRGEGGQFDPVRRFGGVRRERRNLPRARRGGVR